jgi:hypothetical protein
VTFLGVVALAALVTGAVAAANNSAGASHQNQTVIADPTGSVSASASASIKATDEPEKSEAPEPTKAPAATGNPVAGPSCNPTADKVEDHAEDQTMDKLDVDEGSAEGATPGPVASLAPEASEPPSCKPVDMDPDKDSGLGKPLVPTVSFKPDSDGGKEGFGGTGSFTGFGGSGLGHFGGFGGGKFGGSSGH